MLTRETGTRQQERSSEIVRREMAEESTFQFQVLKMLTVASRQLLQRLDFWKIYLFYLFYIGFICRSIHFIRSKPTVQKKQTLGNSK